jgi:plastocyanin domain-containing protein
MAPLQKEAHNIYRKVHRKVPQSQEIRSFIYTMCTLCFTLHTWWFTLRHDKGQANGKLFEQKSIFTKAPNAKWAPLQKEVIM